MTIDWNRELADQLDWHWQNHVRPRLDGLTDDEYLWEPVAGCWSVRPRSQAPADLGHGTGDHVLEFAWPEPAPPPVTTIAWRMAHIIVGILGQRAAAHFGAEPTDWDRHAYAATAAGALAQIDEAYAAWAKGVHDLAAEGLARPCGPAEGPFAEYPLAALVLHINRETIHHMAEIALLRDLYRDQDKG
jgi:DinB superfamily